MKLFPLIIGLLLVLSSCGVVYFIEPQPKGGELQLEVPKELYGKWFGNAEGWQIDKNGLTNININTDSVGNKTYTNGVVSEFTVYKAKELYIAHTKGHGDYWEIIILKPMKNGDINVYYSPDPKLFAHDKNLKLVDSLSFNSAVYTGQMKMKTLRKILTSENLTILKKDGFIYSADGTIIDSDIENE